MASTLDEVGVDSAFGQTSHADPTQKSLRDGVLIYDRGTAIREMDRPAMLGLRLSKWLPLWFCHRFSCLIVTSFTEERISRALKLKG